MTASAHGGEHVTSAAASLASGGGVAAVATNHSDGSTVTLGPLLHGMAPDGSLLVLVGGTAVPPRVADDSRAPHAVIMIDDFAPLVEIRAHIGSLRARGDLRLARHHEFPGHPLWRERDAWLGSQLLVLRVAQLTLTRLGVSVDLDIRDVCHAEIDPLAARAYDVLDAVLGRRDLEFSTLVEEGAGQGQVRFLAVDSWGMHVLADGLDGMGVHRIPFGTRVEGVRGVVDELSRLCAVAGST